MYHCNFSPEIFRFAVSLFVRRRNKSLYFSRIAVVVVVVVVLEIAIKIDRRVCVCVCVIPRQLADWRMS